MKSQKPFCLVVFFYIIAIFCFGKTHSSNIVIDIKDTDTLWLEHVGTKTGIVTIDGMKLSQGCEFIANKFVDLKNNDYIIVINKRTGDELEISAKGLESTNKKTVSSFIRTRCGVEKGISDFGELLESFPWQMINDTINIPTAMILDDSHYFILKTIPGNIDIKRIPYNPETNELVLTKTFFQENNIDLIEDIDFTFYMEYCDDEGRIAVTDKFIIQYIPIITE